SRKFPLCWILVRPSRRFPGEAHNRRIPMNDTHQPNRPTLGAEEAEAREAIDAVARLVEELQAGWDQHDADLSNRHFAADIMWGSPFGATIHGYEELHAIHVRLKRQSR